MQAPPACIKLTALVGGRSDGCERLDGFRSVAHCPGRRPADPAEAVGCQRPHVAVIADDRDANGRRTHAAGRRAAAARGAAVAGRGGGPPGTGAAPSGPAAAADHVVVGADRSRRRRSARPLQPLRQAVTPRGRQSRRRRRHHLARYAAAADTATAATALEHSLVFALHARHTQLHSMSNCTLLLLLLLLLLFCPPAQSRGREN